MYRRQKLIILLLSPSLFSGLVAGGLGLLVLGYNAWTYISQNQLFYNYIFGAYGLKTFFWQQSLQATNWQHSFFGSPFAYYSFVAVAALIAGLLAYSLLEGLSLVLKSGSSAWRTVGSSRNTQQLLRALLGRLGLRVLSLFFWAIYAAFFFSTLLPFCVVLNQVGIDKIESVQLTGWLNCAAALGLLLVALHVHVIFMRLALLRPRVFFGERAVEAASAN